MRMRFAKLGGSDNALRHTLLTILCSVALAWICVERWQG